MNPERPWPALDRLREVTEAHGFALAPRLTIYPEFALDPERWLDAGAALPRCSTAADAEGLGRDDPGAVFAAADQPASPTQVDDGAEVRATSATARTAWYSGASVDAARARARPPAAVPAARSPRCSPASLLGQELGEDEIVTLFSARGPEVARRRRGGRRAAPRRSSATSSPTSTTATSTTRTSARSSAGSAASRRARCRSTCGARPTCSPSTTSPSGCARPPTLGATEVCLQGGIHPDFDGDYYIDVTRAVKDAAPDIHVHGFTALEVTEGAKRLGEPLGRLPAPADGRRPAHAAGHRGRDPRRRGPRRPLPRQDQHRASGSTPTAPPTRSGCARTSRSCSASIEQPVHWARHLVRTRDLQKETGGFTEFVPLPFVHMAAPIYLQHKARRGPTFREAVLMHAVGRIAYHGLDRQHPGLVGEARRRRRARSCCRPASTTSAAR